MHDLEGVQGKARGLWDIPLFFPHTCEGYHPCLLAWSQQAPPLGSLVPDPLGDYPASKPSQSMCVLDARALTGGANNTHGGPRTQTFHKGSWHQVTPS